MEGMEEVKRRLGAALSLDGRNEYGMAFGHYACALGLIARELQSRQRVLTVPEATEAEWAALEKLLSLVRHSLDRSEEIVRSLKTTASIAVPPTTTTTTTPPVATQPSMAQPYAEAEARNRHLKKQYDRVSKSRKGRHGVATDVNLWFLRQYAENLAIAQRKQERMIHRAAEEESRRKQHDKSSRTGAADAKDVKVDVFALFAYDDAMRSTDVQALTSKGGVDATILTTFLWERLRSNQHAMGRLVASYAQRFLTQQFHGPVSDDSQWLRDIVESIQAFQYRLSKLLVGEYSSVKWSDAEDREVDEVIFLCVERAVFHHVFRDVFNAYANRFNGQDEEYAEKLKSLAHVTKRDCGIKEKFLLLRNEKPKEEEEEEEGEEEEEEPYHETIVAIQQIPTETTPCAKIERVMEACQTVVHAVETYWRSHDRDALEFLIGADDLVPILTYALIKAAIPRLHCETGFMCDLLPEFMAIGEGGYTLTTLQTALNNMMGMAVT